MNANLTLSKTTATSTSAWTGTAHEHVEYINGLQHVYNTYTYSNPDVVSDDTVTVTVPSTLSDVTFTSARLSYSVSQSQSGGSRTLQFADTGQNVTDAAILNRLKAGNTSFKIKFYFRAAGGTGGSGTHYATCTWSDLRLAVEYTPDSKIHGYATADDGTSVYYGIDADNLAQGESVSVRISFTAKQAVTGVSFNLIGNNGGYGYVYVSKTASKGSTWDNTFTFTLPVNDPSEWTSRISTSTDIDIVITYQGNDYFVETGYVTTALKLVRERITPALSLSFTDTSGVYGDYEVYVQERSVLTATPAVTLDTGPDANNAAAVMTLTLDGTVYAAGGGKFDIGALSRGGNLSWMLTVTDSYGVTGTLTGTLTVTSWSIPYLTGFETERYSSGLDTGGNTVYYPDDGGTDIRVTLAGGVYPVNGLNAWTLVMSTTDGTNTYTRTLMSGTDGQTISLDHDRSVFDVQLSATSDWLVTVTLTDSFASTVYDRIFIPKAGAIFNIEKTGVAVGMRSTGTEAQPLFQVAYPTELGSVAIGSISSLGGKVFDTGWVDMSSYINTSNAVINVTPRIRRIGNLVFFCGALKPKASLAQSSYLEVTKALPEEFRPTLQINLPLAADSAGMWLRVNTSGIAQVRNRTGSSIGTSYYIRIDGMYPV